VEGLKGAYGGSNKKPPTVWQQRDGGLVVMRREYEPAPDAKTVGAENILSARACCAAGSDVQDKVPRF
jgi:hypothetical protein